MNINEYIYTFRKLIEYKTQQSLFTDTKDTKSKSMTKNLVFLSANEYFVVLFRADITRKIVQI